MKKILGLDLGTNSIGWAVVNASENSVIGIDKMGSRIIPMDAETLGKFESGNTVSQTKDRTDKRGTRRLRQRFLLRRQRLNRVLNILGFLPKHYTKNLDKYGNLLKNTEPKIAWVADEFGKYKFQFNDSFNEMLNDFKENQPELVANNKLIPLDWTLYYLRKKAITQPISKEEFTWILLNFNQKRGYYQLRGEEQDKDDNKTEELYSLKVVDVKDTGEKQKDQTWYEVTFENGFVYRRTSATPLDWVGKTKNLIVTETPTKSGEIKRTFRVPKEDDWGLLKKKTEKSIDGSGKTVGEYIYDNLLKNPNQKIIGELVRTIERKYYKSELMQIVKKQIEFIPELRNKDLYNECINALYPNNHAYRNSIASRDFAYLLVEDIILYQRPLKSKKSTISDCRFEFTSYINKETNEKIDVPVKCIAKSNPIFQEFRLWQFIQNLRIIEKEHIEKDGKIISDYDVTNQFLDSQDKIADLFDYLNDRKEITQDSIMAYFKIKKLKETKVYAYRWNYVEDKEYPGNITRNSILAKLSTEEKPLLTRELTQKIWHVLYSVTSQAEIDRVFSLENKNQNGIYHTLLNAGFSQESLQKVKNITLTEKDYGSYSEKAIKKLMPLMVVGKYWNVENIHPQTKERIEKIISGEYDEKIKDRVRDKSMFLSDINSFKGLPLWLASYIVYDRHSEASDTEIQKWNKPEDIDTWLKNFKQHSMRNPIVEKVVTETMRTVRDIWKEVGKIDEIHIELGRDMKNPADKRKKMSEQILNNENTNIRIKKLLQEFACPEYNILDVKPYSPSQQDILRIYEEDVLATNEPDDEIKNIITNLSSSDAKKQPTRSDIIKYKCWLEQKYQSPYTGEIISLSRLFTPEYEIEHVIPQSRYFDDSFTNKVICESEVNKLKSNMLGMEFIKNCHGQKVQIAGGKFVEILSETNYQNLVSKNFAKNRTKMKKLLMEDIPEGFIERQLNDSRYISKFVKGILSNIVRELDDKGNPETEAVSKNIISCNGSITDRLKKDWGMNDVWNEIILPRFIRLNKMQKEGDNKFLNELPENAFTSTNTQKHIIPNMPFDLQKGFNKKRIDHRHHAMDALVIACTTRDHVNLLNNIAAVKKFNLNRRALNQKLRNIEKTIDQKSGKEIEVFAEFKKPWETFTTDAKVALQNIIVTFKQNLRVINKTVNYFESYKDENGNLNLDKNGNPVKKIRKQTKGDSWAIRKSMHKDTIRGLVNLKKTKPVSLKNAIENPDRIVERDLKLKVKELLAEGKDKKFILKYFKDNKDVWQEIKGDKVNYYYFTEEANEHCYATRFLSELTTIFKDVTKLEKANSVIEAITDQAIQKILKNHLAACDNNPVIAFSADGIEAMNANIVALNDGKQHKPIYKIRRYEVGDKFSLGTSKINSKKFAEADKGTNLFLVVCEIVEKEEKKRFFNTIPLNTIIDCQKKFASKWNQNFESFLKEKCLIPQESKYLFSLSPNDLVYLPTNEDIRSRNVSVSSDRIYKFVSCTGNEAHFVPSRIASPILNTIELGSNNKAQRAWTGEMIKETCIPIKVDRLGNIISILK